MKRMYSLMALLLSLALLLCGCAGAGRDAAPSAPAAPSGEVNLSSTSMDRGDAAYAEETGPEPAPTSDAAGGSTAQQGEAAGEALAARKIIRDAELEVQTLSYDEFLPALEAAIDEAGGYVQSSYTSGNGYYGSRLRSAEIVARIPAEGLDAFLAGVGGLGNVVDRRIALRDVTVNYVDTETHLAALRTEQESLMRILADAETVEDLIAVQSRLSEVRYEIESYESVLRTYDDQIAMSTVTLRVQEVERETPAVREGFFEEVGRRFSESLTDVGEGFRAFGAWFLGSLPAIVVWLVILAAAAALVMLLVRGLRRRRAAGGVKPARRKGRGRKADDAPADGAPADDTPADDTPADGGRTDG